MSTRPYLPGDPIPTRGPWDEEKNMNDKTGEMSNILDIYTNPTTLDQLVDVDRILVRSLTAGDPLIATAYGVELKRSMAMKGLALAKLLYGIRLNWDMYMASGIDDEYENFVEAQMGVSAQTARKYADMWGSIFAADYVPEEVKQQLQSKPINTLMMIAPAVEEGSLDEEDLQTVLVADDSKIRELVREARGRKTSSASAIVLSIQIRNGKHPRGTVLATQNGVTQSIGKLNLDFDPSDFAHRAVARIVNSSHMLERE